MSATPLTSATILVPVDFDDASQRAVASAVELARTLDGRVVVLHVIPPTAFPEGTRVLPADATDPIDLTEYVSQRARHLLDEHFTSVLTGGVEGRMEARTGHVVETILRAIEECDAKLVVVGTHGRGGAVRMVLGSVAENVVRRSPVPVMVVRGPETAELREQDRAFVTATVASGVIAGAATGALAGPAGAVAGGVIGSVVGAVAGAVKARDDARCDARDRELDDTIGVTRGSLGVPTEAKRPSKTALAEAAAEEERRSRRP